MHSIICKKRHWAGISVFFFVLCLAPLASRADALLYHDLRVELAPQHHAFTAEDRLTWPQPPPAPLEFILHAGLSPRTTGAAQLSHLGRVEGAVPLERWRLHLPAGARSVTLHYGGIIHHPLTAAGQGPGHAGEATPGIIAADGTVLSAASGWYPRFSAYPRHGFTLDVALPPHWEAVSQGAREPVPGRVRWRETTPQEEIYLMAGPFTLYQRGEAPTAMVYLRTPDPALAERYLAATARYLKLYAGLLGDYPYAKFALVENFWETGYGMPSFTLLGPRVIRLPFIIDSAYPHEVLHNWWGNGVYVDAAQGNWSEGLTAYLADHLFKEQAGAGAEYRRDQLQAYAAYVSEARDFPLARFLGRHSGASQAVGYGKGLMFFHMLRLELGDEAFLAGLRRFYREQRFRFAGFEDLRAAFEAASGRSLVSFFAQWTQRIGAPTLAIAQAHFSPNRMALTLEQTQSEAPFPLSVPVAIGLDDGRTVTRVLAMDGRRTTVEVALPSTPVCVAVDPHFDLFRRLLPGELPASLSTVLGGERLLIVLPSVDGAGQRAAYESLARAWADGQPGIEIREDSTLGSLPTDRPVLLLGWNNRYRRVLPQLDDAGVVLEQRRWPRARHGFMLTARQGTVAWLAADDPVAITALARKVPHYGKYSYLVFAGPAAENRLKGQWEAAASPLVRHTAAGDCQVPPRAPLAAPFKDRSR